MVEVKGNVIEVDCSGSESLARYISYKERNSKSEFFLDKKNKSFPVENCEDVSAVFHRIGTYKGDLSTSEIKSRLIKRARELGCISSLPKEWNIKQV